MICNIFIENFIIIRYKFLKNNNINTVFCFCDIMHISQINIFLILFIIIYVSINYNFFSRSLKKIYIPPICLIHLLSESNRCSHLS